MSSTARCRPVHDPPLGLRQIVDQRFRGFEISRGESFREPSVDLREKLARFVASGVGLPPPGEARGGAKFPRQGALSTSAVERPPEVKLGRYQCSSPSPDCANGSSMIDSPCLARRRPCARIPKNTRFRRTNPVARISFIAERRRPTPVTESPRRLNTAPLMPRAQAFQIWRPCFAERSSRMAAFASTLA